MIDDNVVTMLFLFLMFDRQHLNIIHFVFDDDNLQFF